MAESITFETTRGSLTFNLTGDYVLLRATGIGGLGAGMEVQDFSCRGHLGVSPARLNLDTIYLAVKT